jgi:uncharacterized membrane protein YbhN (UPF0104 family)
LNGRLGLAARVAVTGGLLLVVFTRVEVELVRQDFARIDVAVALASIVASYLAWVLNTYKWQRILGAYGLDRDLVELFRLNLAGVFFSLALPGQITGELLKALRLAGRSERRAAVFVSIFVDRLTGLVGLAALGVAGLLLDPPSAGWSGAAPVLAVLAACALGGVAVLCAGVGARALERRMTTGTGRTVVRRLLLGWLRLSIVGGRGLVGRQLAAAVGLGVVSQAFIVAISWAMAGALGIGISFLALTWISAIAALVQLLPISLAGVGPREVTFVSLLGLYGVSANLALALALMLFGVLVLLGLTGGLLEIVPVGDRARPRHLPLSRPR